MAPQLPSSEPCSLPTKPRGAKSRQSEAGNSTLDSDPTANVDPGAILRAILMNAGDWSTPNTSYPARFSSRAHRPLPHPRSVTSPLPTRPSLNRRSRPGAAPSAYSLNPASWTYARSVP